MSTTNGDCVSLMSGTLVRPIARYPGSVATDQALKIAANRVQATLRSNISSGDTIITVGDASRLVPDMLLSIDSEIISITSISGNNLTVVRGFDGTVPSSHASGSTLSSNIDAWHHNALAAEIKAIETALGPNLSNVGGGGSGGAIAVSTAYDFPAQQPGGNLIVGNNVITIAPVPRGVNGTDTNHWLYVSGGTGTPEPVLITGGSAVSGAPSGTLIIQCAYPHSGAWQLSSGTVGIQEALNDGQAVAVPAGTYNLHGTITPPANATIIGMGEAVTTLKFYTTDAKMFNVVNDRFTLQGCTLWQQGTAVAGSYGIYRSGSTWVNIRDVHVSAFYVGVYGEKQGQFDLQRVLASNCISDGFQTGAQGYWCEIEAVNNGGHGIKIIVGGDGVGALTMMTNIQTYNNGGWGLYATGVVNVMVSGGCNYFNNDRLGEIYINCPSADVGYICDAFIQFAGLSVVSPTNNATGIQTTPGSGPIVFDNIHFFGCNGNAATLGSNSVTLTNSTCVMSGVGGQSGFMYDVYGNVASDCILANNRFSSPCIIYGQYAVISGNRFIVNSTLPVLRVAAGSHVDIDGNAITQIGTGNALTIDAGVTYMGGTNMIIGGNVTNNGSLSPGSSPLS